MIVAASTTLLADSRAGQRGGKLPWALRCVPWDQHGKQWCMAEHGQLQASLRYGSYRGTLLIPDSGGSSLSIKPQHSVIRQLIHDACSANACRPAKSKALRAESRLCVTSA